MIAQSDDPMIAFVRDRIDKLARSIRARYETADADVFKHKWRISQIKSQVETSDRYPDATGTLRLSFGNITGLSTDGAHLPTFTPIGAVFESNGDTGDKMNAESWVKSRGSINEGIDLSFLASLDTVGGNSGSPLLDEIGRVIGVLSGGISINTMFSYDDRYRAICVASSGIREVLSNVYHADALLAELQLK